MSQLDIFAHRFGDETHPGHLSSGDSNTLGEAGVRMLSAIQTVVDVLADEVNGGYVVGFADFDSAMTDHRKKRITISGKPLTGARAGTPYRNIAAILTGLAVHEVGHTKRVGIINAAKQRWPNKRLPIVLANIIEDMVLEARTVEYYAGFRDVFDDAFDWVSELTCPKYPIRYKSGGTNVDKTNFVGQVIRYRKYVTFANDTITQDQLRWWEEWGQAITSKMTPDQAVAHIEKALARFAEPEEEAEPEGGEGEPEPGEGEGEPGEGEGEGKGKGNGPKPEGEDSDTPPNGPSIDEDEDTEGEDGDDGESGDGDDTEGEDNGGGSETDAEPIDGTSEAGDEGEDGEGGDDTEGGDGNGEGDDAEGGDIADTLHRKDGGKGATDGDGAGGSGQTVAEASDPDEGFNADDLDKSFDDVVAPDRNENYVLQQSVNIERSTVRLDAKEHGKLRVIFHS